MAFIEMILWWYPSGWRLFISKAKATLSNIIDFFSMDSLIRTLFKPYRQISAASASTNASLDLKFHMFIDRLVSRFIGFFSRLFLLIIGTLFLLAGSIISLAIIILWPLIPLLPILALIIIITTTKIEPSTPSIQEPMYLLLILLFILLLILLFFPLFHSYYKTHSKSNLHSTTTNQQSNHVFNPHNPRVHKARQKRLYHNSFIITVNYLLGITLICLGIITLIPGLSPVGLMPLMLLSFFPFPFMFIYWIRNTLATIPIIESDDFTNLLSDDLLCSIHPNTTPAKLIPILIKNPSALFIMARFGLVKQLFEYLTPSLPTDTTPIYKIAINIRNQTNSESITGTILVVAIIMSIPEHQQILSQLKLSLEDLYQGIIWYNYLNGVLKNHHKPIHQGGIARDFSFGYTPTLQHFATNLSARFQGYSRKIQQAENSTIFNKMIQIFTHEGRQNVALIGPYGSGRTTIVNSFAESLLNADSNIPRSLKFHQIYSLDAPALIANAKDHSDLEYTMISILNEVYSAKNIILCLDNAHLFFEEGPGSVDISNLLTPIIESGSIRIILIMDDQKFLEISAKNPTLANALNRITVHPTNQIETIHILMDQAPYLENQNNVIFTYQALISAYNYSKRYNHDIKMPGAARLLLESAVSYAEQGLVTANSVESAVEETYNVKVKTASDAEDRDKLLNLEKLIHEHMIDQTEAVSAIANALRRAGAGIKNQKRPIGTFLFLGPTGVGKTELAKTLSKVYFNGEDHIIRLDMNEFVSPNDVSRLIQDGSTNAMSLTAQVMKQPFSVILLDEIEKAHPTVLTTLLQVLDEGILRDEKNREISFRDSIIIATSNAGANQIREYITSGNSLQDYKEKLTNYLITSGEFKPEFINRFDEICLFKPLSKEDLSKILDLIIASTNKTLESQKISVELTEDAKSILIERGYDPQMGARPMRRIVQKTVENIVASSILSGTSTPGSHLVITAETIDNVT